MATGPGSRSGTRLQVLYDYEYVTDYGRTVTIKEGEECLLLKRSNENWWLVVKEGEKKPLYVPSSYVKVIYKTVIDVADSCDEPDEIHFDHGSFDEHAEAPTKTVPSPTSPAGGDVMSDTTAVIGAKTAQPEKTKEPVSPTNGSIEEITLQKTNLQKNSVVEKRPSFKSFQKNLEGTEEETSQAKKTVTASAGKASPPVSTTSSLSLQQPAHKEVDYVNLDDFRQQAGLPQLVVQQPSEDDGPDYANLDFIQESIRKRKEEQEKDTSTTQQNNDDGQLPDQPGSGQSEAVEEEKVTTPERAEDSQPVRVIDEVWEVHLDLQTGQEYYYNTQTQETSWDAPENVDSAAVVDSLESVSEDQGSQDKESNESLDAASSPRSPASPLVHVVPDGWKEEKDGGGEVFFFNNITKEKWFSSVDETGRTYYYKENTKESLWSLPQNSSPSSGTPPPPSEDDGKVSEQGEVRRKDFQQLRSSWATWGTVDVVDIRRSSLPPNALSQVSPKSTLERAKKDDAHHPSTENKYLVTDLRGVLNKTKITEANKKVKKNWEKCYAVLSDTNLYFYKDQKAATPKGSSSVGKPDITLDIHGATVAFGSKEKTSKKNTVQLSINNGTEYLLSIDDPNRLHAWYVSLSYASKQKGLDASDDSLELEKRDTYEVDGLASPKSKQNRKFSKKLTKSATVDEGFELTEEKKKKIRERLRKFLKKRPSPESLHEKGIIKESVFGSRISLLCEREKSPVPKFVLKILEAIEQRGLEVDGIYRVNGNLAQVQKLRFMVDHSISDRYDFENPDWDVHVLTSALKLFFRELKEPVFPFKFLNKFTAALQLPDAAMKQKAFHDLIHVLPRPNRETLRALFKHLTLVISQSAANRMQSQNVAIVFGPTLMWAEEETMSMAVSMVCQTQIVDYMLLDFNNVFS